MTRQPTTTSSTNAPRRSTIAWRLAFFGAILLSTASVTAFGQSLEPMYERALLDTALKYELLKPTHLLLQKTNEHLRQENESLRNELRFERLQRQLDQELYQRLLAQAETKRRRARWLGRFEGFGVGLLVPL